MALPVLPTQTPLERAGHKNFSHDQVLPHDVGPARLLVGEGLRPTQTGLVPVQQVPDRRAGRAVFT